VKTVDSERWLASIFDWNVRDWNVRDWNVTRSAMLCGILVIASCATGSAQTVPYQRAFPQSKTVVEKRLKELQSASSGHLPVLDGFTIPGDRPLDRFRRGFFQCTAEVSSVASGGSMVRVNATITAWYTDPASAKSGYQVLPSNGRLEADFLDRLQDALGSEALPSSAVSQSSAQPVSGSKPTAPTPTLSAPMPGSSSPIVQRKSAGSPFKLGDPLNLGNMPSLATQKAMVDRKSEEEAKEAKGLEEILHNQVHPNNLVAIRTKDTPVLASPSEGAKVLFLAAAEDEFEILDVNPNWVHVRISGISRGWIRRSSLEMLTAQADTQTVESPAQGNPPVVNPVVNPAQDNPVRSNPVHGGSASADAQPFRVENEQVASFPGTWQPLLGKTVRIVSVQKASDSASATGPAAKLAFAKSLLDQEYADLSKTSSTITGVVAIFDSEDGGMVAATLPALRQWKAGTMSDQAFWRRCLFDPPEAFGMAANQ
jgi:hypothetical protein